MELKVGDKVRLIKSLCDWNLGCEGVIIEVRPPDREYHYKVLFHSKRTKRSFHYPLGDDEVEKIVIKNQQLLFAFMKE